VTATPSKHAGVLRRVLGRLARQLNARAGRELAHLVEDYRRGVVPLVVPLTLLRQHVRRLAIPDLQSQSYLELLPEELALRSRV
jgi:uncharacterized protein YbgA (DUF1722 family)